MAMADHITAGTARSNNYGIRIGDESNLIALGEVAQAERLFAAHGARKPPVRNRHLSYTSRPMIASPA
jgi:hypothetical protein